MTLISSLMDVALAQHVPFYQPQPVECREHVHISYSMVMLLNRDHKGSYNVGSYIMP